MAFLGNFPSQVERLTRQLGAIVSGVNALAIFLFFPETQYFRQYQNPSALADNIEKGEKQPVTLEVQDTTAPQPSSLDSFSGSKKSYLQELKLWSRTNPNARLINLLLRPWPCIVYPMVLYTLLLYSAIVAWVICVISTNASLFQKPPYNMSPGINSLIKIPSFVGISIGVYCGGRLTDRYAAWRARKNDGIFEPETRLETLILAFFIVPAGLLMFFHGFSQLTYL